MPLYRHDEEIEEEVASHGRQAHPFRPEISIHVTEDGRMACREYLCLWVSTRKMKLSPNNKAQVEN